MALIDQRLVRMGTINSDSLSVALENLNDEDSLGYLTQSARTGLVISIFMDGDETPHAISEGALARAVWDRLKALAPAEHDRFVKFLDGLEARLVILRRSFSHGIGEATAYAGLERIGARRFKWRTGWIEPGGQPQHDHTQ